MKLEAKELALAHRLAGVSLGFDSGTITAICGPNGAGKSSLLQCLAGLLRPDGGEVMLDGEPLGALHPRFRAQKIGYLPQDPVVAWDVSAGNLVALGRLPHRDRGEAQVAAAMVACDCAGLAARPVMSLSGGERARVLLARVLAGEPEWILADEPFAALDLGHRLALADRLAAQARTGRGVALVVHDLAMAMNRADRVVVLDNGRTVADGPPVEALSPAVLRAVWQVEARWIGDAGNRALVAS